MAVVRVDGRRELDELAQRVPEAGVGQLVTHAPARARGISKCMP
jgi:hypothetical protein